MGDVKRVGMAYDYLEDSPLTYDIHDNALLVPTSFRGVFRDIRAAVFDSKGECIETSLITRTWTPPEISFPPDISGLDRSSLEIIEEPHIYGGYFFDHFGHFLLESLARLWVKEELGRVPIAWACGGPPNGWQSEVLCMLGLDVEHRFPDQPVVFRRLIIPQPGYRIQTFFHPRHATFLSQATPVDGEERRMSKVWLSRTEISDRGRRSYGEKRLQRILRAKGWTIYHPQKHTVSHQIRMIEGARVVAGLEGSAFHSAILTRRPETVFVVLRKTTSPNYATIARRMKYIEFDLYGAWRINRRRRFARLHRPAKWARIVDGLVTRILETGLDTGELQDLKTEYEHTFDYETWDRVQAGRTFSRLESDIRYMGRKAIRRFLRSDLIP